MSGSAPSDIASLNPSGSDSEIFRLLFENMDDGFCVIEFLDGPHGPLSDYIHIIANAAYERHTGIPNVVGQRLRDMVPDEADDWIAFYGKVLRTGEPIRFRNELVATSRHLEVSSFRLGPFENRLVAVLFKDVTDKVLAEQALHQLNETLEQRVADALAQREQAEMALRQAQKMEAVGQLTGGLAHDFNNLLAGITGSFEMIARRMEQGRVPDAERYVTAGLGAARRAASLTHRLLAFSRRQTLSPRPTSVNALLADFIELVGRTVGPEITVKVASDYDAWPALVDANQLENALLNLCINARDAMPDGGVLTIETLNVTLDQAGAEERGMLPGDYISVTVSDTGVGIASEDLERVFEPFFTTKPMGRGTGLGLSMVYGFARQSNGLVRIRSTPGQGTSVRIYLPRHDGPAELAAAADADARGVARAGASVLVVDDEPTVRMMMVDALGLMDFRCIEAHDGASAFALLDQSPEIDLLVTDVGLPGGVNGRQVADEARRRQPGLKVLFVTGYADTAVLQNERMEPGIAVLTKPFTIDDLQRRAVALLDAVTPQA
ncbi:ATP-binding protein [Novosphingobium sp. MMS21-SN21R]|uniref:ATP-binding protein n=1 Tax=Novosphingobium sp. MMS21-SN21R TaxID=2969298 RepID=UPI0028855B9C|nr:ATP-binding protein [Novosphingobium sp. MMS21-SN21R]MDT0506590.1 ATP-binding protein [Novosphingobium sp. MMS21-SN21R]